MRFLKLLALLLAIIFLLGFAAAIPPVLQTPTPANGVIIQGLIVAQDASYNTIGAWRIIYDSANTVHKLTIPLSGGNLSKTVYVRGFFSGSGPANLVISSDRVFYDAKGTIHEDPAGVKAEKFSKGSFSIIRDFPPAIGGKSVLRVYLGNKDAKDKIFEITVLSHAHPDA